MHGCFNTVAYLVLEACLADGIRNVYELLHTYGGEWVLPGRVGSPTLKEMFSKRRSVASRAYFVRTVLLRAGRCVAAGTAFVELAGLVDLLTFVPLGLVTVQQLRSQVAKVFQACIDAGWAAFMHPVFHWLVHLPVHLAAFQVLPTCWVHESKRR